jgi:Mrp family chromosome partitioning ATPase
MSRNFELMQRLEDLGVFGGLSMPAAAPYAPDEPENASSNVNGNNGHSNGHGSLDLRARAEITRLVHTLFLSAMNAPHQVLFCSVDEGDASGRLCVGAGEVLASEVPLPVCVVDAKVRAPSLHRFFHSDGCASRENGARRLPARQMGSNLWFLSLDGTLSNGDLARGAEQLRASLREVRKQFGYVLIDAEPVGQPADAAALGPATDGVVLVLEANATRRVAALSAKEALEAAGVRLLGTVLNDRTFPIPETLYRKL